MELSPLHTNLISTIWGRCSGSVSLSTSTCTNPPQGYLGVLWQWVMEQPIPSRPSYQPDNMIPKLESNFNMHTLSWFRGLMHGHLGNGWQKRKEDRMFPILKPLLSKKKEPINIASMATNGSPAPLIAKWLWGWRKFCLRDPNSPLRLWNRLKFRCSLWNWGMKMGL